MLLGLVGMTFSTVMASQWNGRGYFWQAAALTLLIGAINLLAKLVLIPRHVMRGAVIVFVGTYALSVLEIARWHYGVSRERVSIGPQRSSHENRFAVGLSVYANIQSREVRWPGY
jgi:O-antigen/teichoic acid export membrane protein